MGRRSVRNGQTRIVRLRKRPSRNVSTRFPTLGYASGGISSVVRSPLKDFTAPATAAAGFGSIYSFSLATALASSGGYQTTIPVIYTNFRINRVSFRVVPLVPLTQGGAHSMVILDDSMGIPTTLPSGGNAFNLVTSRGGAVTAKITSPLAAEWVPTEPEDQNYRDATTVEIGVVYAAVGPSNFTASQVVSKLFADINLTARTFSPVTPTNFRDVAARLQATTSEDLTLNVEMLPSSFKDRERSSEFGKVVLADPLSPCELVEVRPDCSCRHN